MEAVGQLTGGIAVTQPFPDGDHGQS
jgi:hypothetical protein